MSTISPESPRGAQGPELPESTKKPPKAAMMAQKIAEQAASAPTPQATHKMTPIKGDKSVGELRKVFEETVHGHVDAADALFKRLTSKLELKGGKYFIGTTNTGLTPEKLAWLTKLSVKTEHATPSLEPTQAKVTLAGGRKRKGGHTLLVTKDPAGKVVSAQLVVSRLGTGGFGKVMKVVDLETGALSFSKNARTERSFRKDMEESYNYEEKLQEWEDAVIGDQYGALVEEFGEDEVNERFDTREKILATASEEVLKTKPLPLEEAVQKAAKKAGTETLREYNMLSSLHEGEEAPPSIQPKPEHKVMRMTKSQADPLIGFSGKNICEGDGRVLVNPNTSVYQHFHDKEAKELRKETIGELLAGMNFAHAKGIYHLDLKPANCLVGRFDKEGAIDKDNGKLQVLLADWGGGCQRSEVLDFNFYGSGTGEHIAKGDFIAYERAKAESDQAQIEEIFAKRDVFALGTTMLMMLSGKNELPYYLDENNFPDLSPENFKPQEWEEFLLKTYSPEQTQQLTALFTKMLAPEWSDRPSMAEAMETYRRITVALP